MLIIAVPERAEGPGRGHPRRSRKLVMLAQNVGVIAARDDEVLELRVIEVKTRSAPFRDLVVPAPQASGIDPVTAGGHVKRGARARELRAVLAPGPEQVMLDAAVVDPASLVGRL